jgi:dTDP-4-dehydrorhamnose reductase
LNRPVYLHKNHIIHYNCELFLTFVHIRIKKSLENYRILIIGASGLVGSNCYKLFKEKKDITVEGTYYLFNRPELHYYDTLKTDNAENFDIVSYNPTHILHAGALTHVDYCEQHPEESYQQTVASTNNLLAIADKLGSKFIYISTDYVFDGEAGPYHEKSRVNPISMYGRHKLEAEEGVLKSFTNNLILRVTNVYGDEVRNKNFIARLIEMGLNQKESTLNLPLDQYATPVNALDIAKALYNLIADDKSGIYNIASTDYLNRVQLAEKVLMHFPQHRVKINSRLTSELDQPAKRPLQGGLKAAKFLAEYPDFYFSSVDEYLVQKLKRL